MKKTIKAGAFLLALLLLAGIVYLADTLTGYPVSYFVVKHSLNSYMNEHYADTDFVAENPEHSIKLGGFTVWVNSPSSPDSTFMIHFKSDGSFDYDTYDTDVTARYNTAQRLSRQYNKLCETVVRSAAFPYPAVCSGTFDDAIYGGNEERDERKTYPEHWNTRELQLDADYNISEFSGRYGTVVLNVTADDVSLKTAETSLLELRRIMEDANIPFCAVDLWVDSTNQDELGNPIKTLHILDFGWDDTKPEVISERLQAAFDAENDSSAH